MPPPPPRHARHARISPPSWVHIVARMGFRRAAGVAGPFHAAVARRGRARRYRPPEFSRFAVLRHARARNGGFHLRSPWPPQRHQDPPAPLPPIASPPFPRSPPPGAFPQPPPP